MVVNDVTEHKPASGDFPAKTIRTLHLVEQGPDPLQMMPKLSIAPDDAVSPSPLDKPNPLNGRVVEVAIVKIAQADRSKEITFTGKLVSVGGFMAEQPATSEAKK